MSATAPHSTPARFVFVSGCPRSGTTVMATLLNWSDSVLIGQERYSVLLRTTPEQFGPALFTPERLRTFNPGECGYSSFEDMKEYSAHYARPKDFRAIGVYPVRGDKITHLYESIDRLDAPDWAGKDIVVLHMVRDAVDVACSYETRKRDAADGWHLGYEAAIHDWTESVHRMHDYVRRAPGRVRVGIVSYENVFSGGYAAVAAAVGRIYRFAGLELGEKQLSGVRKIHKASDFFRRHRQVHQKVVDDIGRRISAETIRQYEFLRERSI